MNGADFDAIVVGGGPAGASTAILLAAAGWSVALIERQRFPRRKVCGECIAASNLPLFDALGIGDAFDAAAGVPLRAVALMQGPHTIVGALPPADGPHRWGRALARTTLDTLLVARAAAAGVAVLQPASLRALDGRPGAWRCAVASGDGGAVRTLAAPVVVAAHGSWQRVGWPAADGGGESGERRRTPSDLFAFKADFGGGSLPDGLLPVLSFPGGYGGMVRSGGDVTTLAGCVRRDALDAARAVAGSGASAGDALEALVRDRCRGVDAALAGAVRDDAWLGAGPLRPGIRIGARAATPGPFLVGNAAGEAHPIIGEGISMALQSAWLLAARLIAARDVLVGPAASGAAHDAVQRAYAAAWRAQFAPRLRIAATLAHLAMRPAVTGPLLPLLRARPGLLGAAARAAGKVRCAPDAATIAAIRPHAAGRSVPRDAAWRSDRLPEATP